MRFWLALALFLPLVAAAQSPGFGEDSADRDRRREDPVLLPQFPETENYLPFEVSATTPFAFFVDAKSISVGAGGVVRYSLIAKSADGGFNVSFEGMRCSDGQFRTYAFGRADKTWSGLRNSRWEAIRVDPRNAPRAMLYRDFFCTLGREITSADAGIRALKTGGNSRTIISD